MSFMTADGAPDFKCDNASGWARTGLGNTPRPGRDRPRGSGRRGLRCAASSPCPPMDYLSFDLSEGADGVTTLEALASTAPGPHAAVMAEVQQVLDWAWRHFPRTHGPL